MKQDIVQPNTVKDKESSSFFVYSLTGFLIIFIFLSGYFAYAFMRAQMKVRVLRSQIKGLERQVQEIKSGNQSKIELKDNDSPANWQTYQNKKEGYEVKSPVSLGKDLTIEIKSLDEMKKFYQGMRQAGEICPGSCGDLVKDKKLLEKQFEILKKSQNCPYSEEFKKEIIKNFVLTEDGAGGIREVTSIKNQNLGICGVKLLGYAGYDVWLGNYYYQVFFLKNNRMIHFKFSLFPVGVFSKIDGLWKSFGFDFSSGGCDAECSQKMADYYDHFSLQNDQLARDIIQKYDIIVKSFKFL